MNEQDYTCERNLMTILRIILYYIKNIINDIMNILIRGWR